MKQPIKNLKLMYHGAHGILLRWILLLACLATPLKADVNILIIGNTKDSSEYFGGGSRAFNPSEVRSELEKILSGAGIGSVNVTLQERGGTYSLFEWFHYPYPVNVETTSRWPNLRGELGTAWDYVVLIGDPYTMEKMPGVYAQGVTAIAQEVAKGSAETVLLMPWPTPTSTATVDHYKNVVYRVGRTGGFKVAPAALAWQAAGKPVGATHPSTNGAYIAAATIYSRLYGQSASVSTYAYNDNLADIANTTVANNIGKPQYTGEFKFQNPFLMLGDKRRQVHFSHKGTSTERGISATVQEAMARCNVSNVHGGVYVAGNGSAFYGTNKPYTEGRGWPLGNPMPIGWNLGRKFSEPEKQYEVNPDVWQLGFGFRYQSNTPDTDYHLGQIREPELSLANYMITEGDSARCLPWRALYAQLIAESPIYPGSAVDGTGHLTSPVLTACGTYLYTLYSGRCPVVPKPAEPTLSWYATKVGYEAAWRMGRCQSRAPGFKVMPASANATEADVTPTTSRNLSVYFVNPPQADVTVSVSVDDPYVGKVSTNLLTFTPENYNQPQTVTVSGLTGKAGALRFNAVFTTSSNDPAYDGVSDSWLFVNTRTEGPLPGISLIQGNGLTIWPAHTSPLTTNGTDFGTVSGPVSRVFTISNTSTTETLNLTKSPRITVIDPAGYFTLSQDATTNTLAPGASTTFQVTFNPPPGVIHTAGVTVETTDPAIPAYTFQVTGSRVGAPTVVGHGVAPSTTTSAMFRGVLGDGGVSANVSICWGAKDGGTTSTSNWENVTSVGSVTQGIEFSKLVTGLNVNWSYVYRFYVTNAAGSSWSATVERFSGEPSDSGSGAYVDPIVFNATTNSPQQAPGLSTNITRSSIVHSWDNVLDAFGSSSHGSYDATAFMFANNRVADDSDEVMGTWVKIPNTSPYGDGSFFAKESVEWIAWNTTAPVTLAGYQLDLSSARAAKRIRFSANGVVVDTYDNGDSLVDGLLNRYFDQTVTGTSFKLEVTCSTTAGPLIREIDAIVPVQALRVANRAPNNITNNQATINGKLWTPQDNSTVTLYWGTTNGGSDPAAWQSSAVVGSWTNVTTNISHVLTSLLPGTRYYYTFSTTNGSTTAWAAPSWQIETTGVATLPKIISTQGATDITATNAQLRGWLTSSGGAATTVTCYWNPGSDPGATTAGWAYSREFGTASGPAQYVHNTADDATLVGGTTYYYRYRAVNSFGTSWSSAVSFTPHVAPEVGNASGATGASETSATLRGMLTAGGSANAWICWGATDGGQINTGNWDHVISIGSVTQGEAFSALVTGINPNTTYYYRCYVTNTVGQDWSPTATFSGTPSESGGRGGALAIVPAPASVTSSSAFSSSFAVSKLFDATVTPAKVGVTSYGTADGQYAGQGVGPHNVFMDYGSPVTADEFVYSQRTGADPNVDKVTLMDFWFESANPGTTLPARAPDATVPITNRTNAILTRYALGGLYKSRYVVMRLTGGTFNPGGSEFRLALSAARISNLAPSGITEKDAILNASLNASGTNYNVRIYYGTEDGGSDPTAWEFNASVGSWTNATTNISHSLSSLLPGTRYYYRFHASNTAANLWASPSWQFTTAGVPGPLTYTVSYNGNGNTGGSPPDNQFKTEGINLTLAPNSGNLVNSGHTFLGWNTASDGTGTDYAAEGTYSLDAALILYAKWSNDPPVVDAGLPQTVYLEPQVTPWTPASISLAAWYDASDTTKITVSNGAVSEWADKSGKNNHATQGTAANRPTTGASLGGLNAITFDGSNDYLTAANESNFDLASYSIFVVGAAANGGSFVGKGDANQNPTTTNTARRKMQFKRGVLGSGADGNSATLSNGSTDSNAALRSLIAVNNTTVNYSYNGLFAPAASIVNLNLTANNNVPLTIGSAFSIGAEFLSGTLGEVIIIGSAVDNDTRQKMEGYLAHKWGLATNLPDDHPYKNVAPRVLGAVAGLHGSASDNNEDTLSLSWSLVSGPGAVVFSDTSGETTTASFSTAGTYVLRLTADDGRAQSYDDVTITVVSPPVRYLTWAGGSFANAFTLTSLNQNQDSDSMSNLQEFAFGMDPTKADSRALVIDGSANGVPVPVDSGEGVFELYFVRRKDHGTSGSASYTVQFSNDLATFHNYAFEPEIVTDSNQNPDYEVVKVTYPASLPDSQPARFGRIMVTPVP